MSSKEMPAKRSIYTKFKVDENLQIKAIGMKLRIK